MKGGQCRHSITVAKAQTPLFRFVVDLFYNKSTTNRTSGVWA